MTEGGMQSTSEDVAAGEVRRGSHCWNWGQERGKCDWIFSVGVVVVSGIGQAQRWQGGDDSGLWWWCFDGSVSDATVEIGTLYGLSLYEESPSISWEKV